MTTDESIIGLANAVATILKGKQDELVSGSNIKTINNQSVLGSGDITVVGSQNVFIQNTEPVVPTGNKVLWIDTTNGNLNFWIKTGD